MKYPRDFTKRFPLHLPLLLLLLALLPAAARDRPPASVHDTVQAITERLRHQKSSDQLLTLTVPQVEAFLTAPERQMLGTGHIRFRVNVPVVVTILRDTSLGEEPFWLRERSFRATGLKAKFGATEFDTWEKAFPAGELGLGVHALSSRGTHYLVLLRPQGPGEALRVTDLYPVELRTSPFVAGAEPYVDEPLRVDTVPAELTGQLLLRTISDSDEDARLAGIFSKTQYPAADRPDHIVLTWSEDPRTTQTIQWRTSQRIRHAMLRYQPKTVGASFDPDAARLRSATTRRLFTPTLVNDPLIQRHTVVLRGLKPATTYIYSVGDGSPAGWSEPDEFTTAPDQRVSFSFMYLGDAQNGLDRWGGLVRQACQSHPEAAFYLMTGDLVTRGAERWDWDALFENAKGVFDHHQLVPALGNHEYQGGEPRLYLAQLSLPRKGPATIPPEHAYAFEYSNAKFIILDSNLDPAKQTAWLEQQLAHTKAVWKFVSYHHPAYSSGGNRENPEVRNFWTPLFDKYHVDLALQGHDHAYLRTYPMNAQHRVASPQDGTIYTISVSGTKHYQQPAHDYTEVGFTKVSTYQVVDIDVGNRRLVYRSRDLNGQIHDEFTIQK